MHSIRRYVSQFQGFNRNVRLFFIGSILLQIGFGAYTVLYNLYIQELGYPPTMNGDINTWKSLAMAIALVPAGILSDRWGRKQTILAGLCLTFISLIIGALAQSSAWLFASAFLIGFFTAFTQVAAIPLLADNSEPDQRIHLFSFYSALIMVSPILGQLGSGFGSDLLHHTFHVSNLASLRTTLFFGSTIVALSFIPIFLLRERSQSTDQANTPSTSLLHSLHSLLRDHKEQTSFLSRLLLVNLLIGTGSGLVIPYLNLYFHDRFHASHSAIGFIVSAAEVVTACSMMVGPWMVTRWGKSKSIAILQLGSIPFLLVTGLTSNFTIAFFAFLVRQALMNTAGPITSTMLMERMDDRFKGLANSMGQMMFMIGWAITGRFSTQLVATYGSYWGYAFNFIITSIIYLGASLYFYLSLREKQPLQLAMKRAS